ncbi:hypothetical protein MHYP_G00148850 [Metynnis hypsauchen]
MDLDCALLRVAGNMGLDRHLFSPFYSAAVEAWQLFSFSRESCVVPCNWIFEEPLFFNSAFPTLSWVSGALRVSFLEAGISKLRHVRRGTAWITTELLADMVGLRSVRMVLQVLDQLRSDLVQGPKIFIEGELVPSYVKGGPKGGYAISRVLLTRPLSLPPQSDCDTWGFVEHPHPEVTAVLEPVGLADSVSSGSVLVNMEPKVPVWLCSISATSTHLAKGTCLGILIETLPLPKLCSKDSCKPQKQDQDNLENTQRHDQGSHSDVEAPLQRLYRYSKCTNVLGLPTHLQELFTSASGDLSKEQEGKDISTLPYDGCAHCQTMQQQWARFETDVDDVVPLAVRHVTKCKETRIAENSASQVQAADSPSSPGKLNNKKP